MSVAREALQVMMAATLVLAPMAGADAQGLQLADNGPRFVSTPTAVAPAIDMSGAPVLQRRVTLEFDRVSLEDALTELGKQARIRFVFSAAVIPVRAPVTVHAQGITVAAALTELLIGLRVDVQLATDGTQAALVPRGGMAPASTVQQGTGTITGRVIDGALKAPLSGVSVRIEKTTLSTTANADGNYAIAGVTPGAYHVTARRVGYRSLTKDVTVAADQSATLDFALVAAPTRLDEVVTTAVGEQRRYEVGNDISTINADSIAPTAPITSLTDLISARAPGVTVLETSGMTGSGEAIRIEGLTSLVLQNDPILIVDGMRQDNSAGGDLSSYFNPTIFSENGTHPTPSRLNDIDFSDIQSIDILKGPSASTEYGTDAANGVIVITTKHGAAGAPQWKASAEQTESDIPVRFPNGYYSWGHMTDGTNTPVNCTVVPPFGGTDAAFGAPYNIGATFGTCVVDSVTQWNPLNHAATTIFGTGNREKYDLSVSGGSDVVRYFVSGGLTNEAGVVELPAVFRQIEDTANLGLPSAALGPNVEQQRSVRTNTAITLGRTADLTATASYLSTFQQTPNAENLYEGVFFEPALGDPAHEYGYALGGESGTPLAQLSEFGSDNTSRLTGGVTANWRPADWFVGHATVGLDHGSQRNEELNYPLANPAYQYLSPSLGLGNATTDVYSADLRGTATASLGRRVRAVTSGGLQMVDTRTVGQSATVMNITATNLTLNGATGVMVAQQANRQATLGGYGEEQVSFADRLFLTGALRIDAASGFGRAYATAAYPKASVSWLAIDQGPTTVRIRGAFGESGVQPANGAALQLYAPTVAYLGGAAVTTNLIDWPGNPDLRPERSEEFEGGVDIGAWGNRLSVALTGYSKLTQDALVDVNLGATLGDVAYQENIGSVRNVGVEGTATIGIIQARSVTWDIALNASVNHNTLLTLAPGVIAQTLGGAAAGNYEYRQDPGFPLYGIWAQKLTYADANNDGIIGTGEVTLADSESYVGSSLPTQEASVSTHVGLWRGALTVGGLVDYRGGFRIANIVTEEAAQAGNLREENDPTAPEWLQARAVQNASFGYNALDIEDGTFVRVREVSLTYAVPHSLLRELRVHSLSITGAVRNLALWTRYTGPDPEVSQTSGGNVQQSLTAGGNAVNNDIRADAGTVPLARYWVLRLNVGM